MPNVRYGDLEPQQPRTLPSWFEEYKRTLDELPPSDRPTEEPAEQKAKREALLAELLKFFGPYSDA